MKDWRLGGAVLLVAAVVVLNLVVLTRLRDLGAPPPFPAPTAAEVDRRPVVRIGVVSRYAPALTYERYQPIIDHLSAHGTHRYELRLSTSYEGAADQLARGEVAASFFGTWIYARVGPRSGLEPILAPRNEEGGTTFHAALVAPVGSPIASVRDLAGRRVALPSPSSFAGNWLTVEALPQAGLLAADLDSVHHFDFHQTVAHRVLDGQFDAGVVREAVAREFEGQGLRVIARSGGFPGPPLVVRAGRKHAAITEITRLLLALRPLGADGSAITRAWAPEFAHGFVEVDAATYAAMVDASRTAVTP